MPNQSKISLALLVGVALLLGGALSNGAMAKDHRKLCGNADASKAQMCGKHMAKIKTKKPGTGDGKGIPASLLLQLLF